MTNSILIVVAHSDDETIGMGGTIKNHTSKGDNVFLISMTDGVSAWSNKSKNLVEERIKASEKASSILNFKWERRFSFPDNQMDNCSILEIVKSIEEVKFKIQPKIVYTHSSSDLNIDHGIVSRSVLTAFRPQPNEHCNEIRLFEVPSATDFGHEDITGNFKPNLFINISDSWPYKLKALNAYSSEMKIYPHTRSLESIKNLAKWRGNQVGLDLAEAFQVIRKIDIC